jgi:hypothetical protein
MDEYGLRKRFFLEGDKFDTGSLTQEEFDYYISTLATQRSSTIPRSVLYFDKQNYTVIRGEVRNDYNSNQQLIADKYYVQYYRQIAVKDNLLDKLSGECGFLSGQVIFTNISVNSILGRKIAIKGDYKLLKKQLPTELDKSYEDLIGVIESQSDFFKDDTFFREQIKLIEQSEKEKIPSSILALIFWYSTF